jgi:prepilin-type N-terminal cleavage/methylation domain-containing protein
MMKRGLNQNSGFTLIELVMTIALAGLVMLMIMSFFQSGITTSPRPAQWLQDAMTVQRAMESINGAYGKILTKNTAALQSLSTTIGPAGSSNNNLFGVYNVLENQFITFKNNGDEQSGGTTILKVTICSPSNPGNQLTQLLTVQVPH